MRAVFWHVTLQAAVLFVSHAGGRKMYKDSGPQTDGYRSHVTFSRDGYDVGVLLERLPALFTISSPAVAATLDVPGVSNASTPVAATEGLPSSSVGSGHIHTSKCNHRVGDNGALWDAASMGNMAGLQEALNTECSTEETLSVRLTRSLAKARALLPTVFTPPYSQDGTTAFLVAAENGQLPVVRKLYEAGAVVSATTLVSTVL